jgi:hypothetical protein
MKIKLLIVCALLTASILNAQTDFRPGYVIGFSGDTLYGEIDYRGDLLMGSLCKYKAPDGTIAEYTPYDIAAYRLVDSKYFVSKEIAGKIVFLEYLINGQISFYYLRDEYGDHYYIYKDGMGMTELPYEEGVKRVNLQKTVYETGENEEIVYNTTRHIGLLKFYMQDYPEINSKIESLQKPDHAPLIRLAEKYHNGICPDEQCLIYEKKLPLLNVALEPYWAMYGFHGAYEDIDFNYKAYGANIYLSMPRVNENLFFKLGIENMNSYWGGEFYEIRKFPIQIQYIYSSHKFQPKLSAGVNYWSIIDNETTFPSHTLCLNVGYNYELMEHLGISVDFGTEFTPLVIAALEIEYNDRMKIDLLTYSLKFGLYYDF